MLTLITGTPGAGKSLYAVWELARKVPGSTVEKDGQAIPRRLLSNVKDLLLEHETIGPEQLDKWHEWAQPGDVILFDEVQEVWRPRGLGTKVPDCIAALETHRHKGVDIILITQHPMLVDPNIRRLVNQHLHVRRLAKSVAMVYEWDHCSNPGMVKTALQSRVWFHPKQAYKLYKSAQVHTKPVTRLPRVALLGVAAVAVLAYVAPMAYGRITERLGGSGKPLPEAVAAKPAASGAAQASGLVPPPDAPESAASSMTVTYIGCIASSTKCRCWDAQGVMAVVTDAMCRDEVSRLGNLVAPNGAVSAPVTPVPPSRPEAASPGEAAAPGRPSLI